MTTRTTIEFQRVPGTELASGNGITDTVNGEVVVNGESFQVDLPAEAGGNRGHADTGRYARAVSGMGQLPAVRRQCNRISDSSVIGLPEGVELVLDGVNVVSIARTAAVKQ